MFKRSGVCSRRYVRISLEYLRMLHSVLHWKSWFVNEIHPQRKKWIGLSCPAGCLLNDWCFLHQSWLFLQIYRCFRLPLSKRWDSQGSSELMKWMTPTQTRHSLFRGNPPLNGSHFMTKMTQAANKKAPHLHSPRLDRDPWSLHSSLCVAETLKPWVFWCPKKICLK